MLVFMRAQQVLLSPPVLVGNFLLLIGGALLVTHLCPVAINNLFLGQRLLVPRVLLLAQHSVSSAALGFYSILSSLSLPFGIIVCGGDVGLSYWTCPAQLLCVLCFYLCGEGQAITGPGALHFLAPVIVRRLHRIHIDDCYVVTRAMLCPYGGFFLLC